jgi:hypothetical protein
MNGRLSSKWKKFNDHLSALDAGNPNDQRSLRAARIRTTTAPLRRLEIE